VTSSDRLFSANVALFGQLNQSNRGGQGAAGKKVNEVEKFHTGLVRLIKTKREGKESLKMVFGEK
jgi:hypothetical protein